MTDDTRPPTPIARAWAADGGQPRGTGALPPERLTDRQKRMAAAAAGPGIDSRVFYSIGAGAVILLAVVSVKLAIGAGWEIPEGEPSLSAIPARALQPGGPSTITVDPLPPMLQHAFGALLGVEETRFRGAFGVLEGPSPAVEEPAVGSEPPSASSLRRGSAGPP